MNSKILKITDPPIKGYPDYAYPLTVALNYEWGWDWLYSNFIQLYFNENDLRNPVRFYYANSNGSLWTVRNPLLNYQAIHRDTLALVGTNMIKLVIDSIDSDNYVMMYLDEYYIRDRWAYQTCHYHHLNFIYGYDPDNRLFYTAGYDKSMNYSYITIGFDEIEQAFINDIRDDYEEDSDHVFLMKVNDRIKPYELSLVTLTGQLREYRYSQNSSERYRLGSIPASGLYFGMDIYRPLKMYFEAVHRYSWNWNTIKPLFILWEHKKLMASRLAYLQQKGYLENAGKFSAFYEDATDRMFNVKAMFLKYKRTKARGTLDKVLSVLDELADQEKVILDEMIEALEAQYEKTMEPRNRKGMYSKPHYLDSVYELDQAYDGLVNIEFEIIASADHVDCLIGYADSEALVTSRYSLPIQLRLNSKGYFDAIDFDQYLATVQLSYRKNHRYKVRLIIDIEGKYFSVYISESDRSYTLIADKHHFQSDSPSPVSIKKVCVVSDSFVHYVEIFNHTVETIRR